MLFDLNESGNYASIKSTVAKFSEKSGNRDVRKCKDGQGKVTGFFFVSWKVVFLLNICLFGYSTYFWRIEVKMQFIRKRNLIFFPRIFAFVYVEKS